MASFWDRINPFGSKSFVNPIANKSFRNGFSNLFTGTPEKRENVSTLRPEQEPLYQQAINAGIQPGAGGAFGTSADYYRDLLSNDPETLRQLSAPDIRRFNEETIPGISEQFAGMGSGGLSSSGFQNAAVNAGTDLSERLGAIRANLRNSGAQGLSNIGQIGLQPYSQNMVTEQGTEGLLSGLAPAIGTGIGAAVGGPIGAGIGGGFGSGAGNWLKNSFGGNKVGRNTGPYGNNAPGQIPRNSLPNFMGGR